MATGRGLRFVYLVEAVVDGCWHWYAGRVEEGRLAGGTTWSTTDETATRFNSRKAAERLQRSVGGVTYVRQRLET